MILYPETIKVKRTEAPFPAPLFDMLQHLSDTLSMQGVALMCVKCGQPIQGCNHPSDPTFYLDCPCARRTFDRTRQTQSVKLHDGYEVKC